MTELKEGVGNEEKFGPFHVLGTAGVGAAVVLVGEPGISGCLEFTTHILSA